MTKYRRWQKTPTFDHFWTTKIRIELVWTRIGWHCFLFRYADGVRVQGFGDTKVLAMHNAVGRYRRIAVFIENHGHPQNYDKVRMKEFYKC